MAGGRKGQGLKVEKWERIRCHYADETVMTYMKLRKDSKYVILKSIKIIKEKELWKMSREPWIEKLSVHRVEDGMDLWTKAGELTKLHGCLLDVGELPSCLLASQCITVWILLNKTGDIPHHRGDCGDPWANVSEELNIRGMKGFIWKWDIIKVKHSLKPQDSNRVFLSQACWIV